jgi:hypothetical protein
MKKKFCNKSFNNFPKNNSGFNERKSKLNLMCMALSGKKP